MGLIRYSCGHISGPHDWFPPNLDCGRFSSCSTDTWYPKRWNAKKKVLCDVIVSVLYTCLTANAMLLCPLQIHTSPNKISWSWLVDMLPCPSKHAMSMVKGPPAGCGGNTIFHTPTASPNAPPAKGEWNQVQIALTLIFLRYFLQHIPSEMMPILNFHL